MVAISTVDSKTSGVALDPVIAPLQPAVQSKAKSVSELPSVSELLSSGVSAAFGLQAPADAGNIEVAVGQVLAEFESLQTQLNENKVSAANAKARSARQALFAELQRHTDLQTKVNKTNDGVSKTEETLKDQKKDLSDLKTELKDLPLDHDNGKAKKGEKPILVKDPAEVKRLTDAIAAKESEIEDTEATLKTKKDALEAQQAELDTSFSAQTLVRTVLLLIASEVNEEEQKVDAGEEKLNQSTKIGEQLLQAKPELDERQQVRREVREIIEDKELNAYYAERGVDLAALSNLEAPALQSALANGAAASKLMDALTSAIGLGVSQAGDSVGSFNDTLSGGRVRLHLGNG
ncbi:hypothetical protein [Polycladidibacter hongkongensis]|uniref:hypothetical protein n=1 Tax=Polycladidibacter hongkongensis TaxID=1647556 RepID=UPI000834AC03|nr:hypothetical protein [Pseudovibrio hongkongensis]